MDGLGCFFYLQFSSVQSLSCVRLVATPWTATCQASLSIIKHHQNSRSLLKLMSIELVMPFNHLILCCSLLLLPSVFPSIRVFFNQSSLQLTSDNYSGGYLYHCYYFLRFYCKLSTVHLWIMCLPFCMCVQCQFLFFSNYSSMDLNVHTY